MSTKSGKDHNEQSYRIDSSNKFPVLFDVPNKFLRQEQARKKATNLLFVALESLILDVCVPNGDQKSPLIALLQLQPH